MIQITSTTKSPYSVINKYDKSPKLIEKVENIGKSINTKEKKKDVDYYA